jgi:Mn2+/Fe2+ NRAMP family transporter
VFAEMAGRVAAMSRRPVFELVRERLGPGVGLVNLVASFFINFLTLTAEIAGVAIALSLVTSVNYLLLVPVAGFLVWLVIWRMPFPTMEKIFGLLGLALLVFVVTVVRLEPNWSGLWHGATHPSVGPEETPFTYAYFAIALLGAAMTPYEVFFFSSGAVEEKWDRKYLAVNRANVYLGFPLGGLLSIAIMAATTHVFAPVGITVETLPQVALPVAVALGKIGLAVLILGVFAATFGAALETALSAGYTLAQYFGWQWGKHVRPRDAGRFHVVVLIALLGSLLYAASGVDPVKVTEYSIVLSAAALPLTYFPILLIANDRDYMGEHANGRFLNAIGFAYLVLLGVVSLATIPLMIITKAGA